MTFSQITYVEPVFRPPGEASSAILQTTIGCSWNRCTFCEMYTSKKFKARNIDDLKPEIELLSKIYKGVRKVFLADGNAFVLSAKNLIPVLTEINRQFGKIQRISSYALPKDILNKSDSELQKLRSLGLKLLYLGIETGDDELLKLINKGETYNSTIDGILKAQEAGIDTSIMIINGLGGKKYSTQHAVNSAKIINRINPKYLSTLTLSFPYGLEHFQKRFNGKYSPLTITEHFKELKTFITHTELNSVIYRSDHISNNLVLKGILSKDKKKLIDVINMAIDIAPKDVYPSTPSIL
ncbi:MAG: radical SAM protein [Bacteroidales bacterium]|nr:radical SAM protein [Bacteroidales bacterium]